MKVWMIVLRADEDAAADGVTDEVCQGQVFKRLDRAKRECETLIKEDFGEEVPADIDWAETSKPGESRRLMGRPRSNVDMTFELYQAEVV